MVCGAKTKKGTVCQKAALKNGRCRIHGGKSTGPKDKKRKSLQMKGNKNALKTGEYETISFETLSEKEKELYERVSTDPAKQVNGRYKMLEIRTYRLMQRYAAELEKKNPSEDILEKLELSLTRIDTRVVDLIRENRSLSSESIDNRNGSLGDLVSIIADIRKRRLGS
ncbi:HGGxSTG domain-containing protein [Bacillus subtilis]|uniref:HGGxSTG domain-containing protein n=1 Tax=Bacillus subtilis TaxID=1423 RepID=UPI00257497FA|nr:HGGxSTG domain-containing protein [Bacillus subtilis]